MRTTNLWQRQDFTLNKLPPLVNNSHDILSMNTSTSVLIPLFIIMKATSQSSLPRIFTLSLVSIEFHSGEAFIRGGEGAVPVAVFEFLSDSTANQDRNETVHVYLIDMGVQEYFIHQPEMKKPVEFRGWRQSPLGEVVEIAADEQGGLFSEALNLWLRWSEEVSDVRLLRPYLPDGTPITTAMEEHHLRLEAEAMAALEAQRRSE